MTLPSDSWVHKLQGFISEPAVGTRAPSRNPQALSSLCSKDSCQQAVRLLPTRRPLPDQSLLTDGKTIFTSITNTDHLPYPQTS